MGVQRRFRELMGVLSKERQCPICGWSGFRFEPFGNVQLFRHDAMCPCCGSLERHRAGFLLVKDKIGTAQKVLHVAPERTLVPWLISVSSEYLSIDLYSHAMRRMDLTNMELPDESQTLIWCSHVLDLIAVEKKALSEIYRVLTREGVLVLQVFINGQTTKHDSSTLKQFFHEGRLRVYGLDIKELICSAGFSCEVVSSSNLSKDAQRLYGLLTPGYRDVFVCRKWVR
jgi:hypothetical protein